MSIFISIQTHKYIDRHSSVVWTHALVYCAFLDRPCRPCQLQRAMAARTAAGAVQAISIRAVRKRQTAGFRATRSGTPPARLSQGAFEPTSTKKKVGSAVFRCRSRQLGFLCIARGIDASTSLAAYHFECNASVLHRVCIPNIVVTEITRFRSFFSYQTFASSAYYQSIGGEPNSPATVPAEREPPTKWRAAPA